MEIKYIDYFNTTIKDYIPEGLTYETYEEFNYFEKEIDIKFTIVRLTGSIDSGMVTIPFQIIAEIDSKWANEVRAKLDEYAIDFNAVITSDIGDRKFKQFLSTSYKINTFQSNGLIDRTAIGLNVTLTSFGDADVENIIINDDDSFEYQNIATTYSTSVSSVGARSKDLGILKRKNRDVALTYALTFVPKNTSVQKEILAQILSGESINKTYTLKIVTSSTDEEGTETDVTTTVECVLTSGSVNKAKNGAPIIQAVFAPGDFEV